MRRYAREVAFCLTYAFLFNGEKDDLSMEMFNKNALSDDDVKFATELYNGSVDNLDFYKQKVAKYSVGFKLERIFRIDLAILVLSMYEIEHTDTPPAVCVNEAVELAKKYSTQKSLSFVNGLLGEYIKQEVEPKNV